VTTEAENTKAASGRRFDPGAAIARFFNRIAKGNMSSMPPCLAARVFKLKPLSTDEVEDFLSRNWAHIEKETRPLVFKHTCPYPPGSTEWFVTWRFPFVRRHVYNTICCCDINFIMDEITHELKRPDGTRRNRERWGITSQIED
jgi:hypothetical protein